MYQFNKHVNDNSKVLKFYYLEKIGQKLIAWYFWVIKSLVFDPDLPLPVIKKWSCPRKSVKILQEYPKFPTYGNQDTCVSFKKSCGGDSPFPV
jgi:hypothetical protein